MEDQIRYFLGDTAAGLVPGVRAAQLEYAACVADVLQNGGIAMLEAGTGTGKSLGYLTPGALSGKRIVVSTAKKPLQSQLFLKDLPHATRVVRPVPFAMLKGRSNYFCRLRYEEFLGEGGDAEFDPALVKRFERWAGTDPVGDLSLFGEELPFEPAIRVNACAGFECPNASGCGFLQNKRRAGDARLVVVNHALLAYDLMYGGGKLLGPYDALVIDEAHLAPGMFRDAFSTTLSDYHVRQLEQALAHDQRFVMPPDFKQVYRAAFQALHGYDVGPLPRDKRVRDAFAALYKQFQLLGQQFASFSVQPQVVDGVVDELEDADLVTVDALTARRKTRLGLAAALVDEGKRAIERVLELPTASDQEFIAFTRKSGHGALEVVVAPVEVGPLVAPALLGTKRVVITSATLATEGSFNFMLREFGLHAGQVRIRKQFASPFVNSRSVLYVSPTAPEKTYGGHPGVYYDAIARETRALLDASKGGAFILCASREDMDALYERLPDYRVAKQTGSVARHVAWFKEDPTSVLLGMKSLWEGVDVPGLGLRLVVIPRIPFPNGKEPLHAARKARIERRLLEEGVPEKSVGFKAFREYDVQLAIMDMIQGAGRLVRAESDQGVVAVLDPRLYESKKGYSAAIRSSIPKKYTYDTAGVLRFLVSLSTHALAPPRRLAANGT